MFKLFKMALLSVVLLSFPNNGKSYTRTSVGYYGLGSGCSFSSVTGGSRSVSNGIQFYGEISKGQELGRGMYIEERLGVGPLGQFATDTQAIQGTLLHLHAVPGWTFGIANNLFQIGFGIPLGGELLLGQAASRDAAVQGMVFVPSAGGIFRFEGALNSKSSVGVELGLQQSFGSSFNLGGLFVGVTWRRGGSLAITQGSIQGTPYQRLVEGEALYQQKKYDEALKLFESVTDETPTNARAWQDLGNVQIAIGERKSAIKAYRKALKLDPGNTKLESFLDRIEGRN